MLVTPFAARAAAGRHAAPPHVPLAVAMRGDARRRRPLRLGRRRRPRRQPASCGRRPRVRHDDAQRAEAVPGDAVRRGRRRRALSATRRRRLRCCARATRASRGTSTRSPRCSPRPAIPPTTSSAARTRRAIFDARGEVPPPPPYSPLAHNCSGKHSGMLAYCVQCGLPKESYLDFDHPLQQAIRRAVAHFTATAGGAAGRRHRRLLGAELRGAACAVSRSAFARLAARR